MPRSAKRDRPFEFFLNQKGVNENDGIFRMDPNAAEYIQNMHPTKTGEYSSHAQGNENHSSELESGARVDAIFTYKDDDGTFYFPTAVNGKVLNINPGTGANDGTVTTSNSAGNLVDFETFKGNLYIAEESMEPEIWTGTGTATPSTAIPATVGSDTYSKPTLVTRYENRLVYGNFYGSTKYPSHIAILDDLASDTLTTATTNDTDGAIIQVSPGDGQELTALISKYLPGSNSVVLLCFKEASIWALSGNTPTTFQISQVNQSFGCLNHNCVVEVGSDIFFIDQNNIYSLTTAFQSGTLQPDVAGSQRVQETLKDMNISQAKEKAWAVHLKGRQEVWFGIPTGSSTEVDTIVVYNYRNKQEGSDPWIIRKGMSATCATVFEEVLYSGTNVGYVRKWFSASQYAGVGMSWIYRLPFYDFESRGQYKRIHELYCHLRVRATTQITVKTTWMIGGNETTKTLPYTISSNAGATWGSFTWGSGYWGGGSDVVVKKIKVFGDGALCQLEVSGTTTTVGVDFLGWSGVVNFGDWIRRYN